MSNDNDKSSKLGGQSGMPGAAAADNKDARADSGHSGAIKPGNGNGGDANKGNMAPRQFAGCDHGNAAHKQECAGSGNAMAPDKHEHGGKASLGGKYEHAHGAFGKHEHAGIDKGSKMMAPGDKPEWATHDMSSGKAKAAAGEKPGETDASGNKKQEPMASISGGKMKST